MIAALLTLLAFAFACDTPTSPSDVSAHVEEAMLAWATLDEDGFVQTARAVKAEIGCLDAPLTVSQAAGTHRVLGLLAFLDGDEPAALAALQAAAIAEPAYKPSDKIAPTGGKLWRLFEQAGKTAAPVRERVAVPEPYVAWVDGAREGQRAPSLPAIVQVGVDGQPTRFSAYAAGGQPLTLPSLPGASSIAVLEDPTPTGPTRDELPRERAGGTSPLWYAAAGTGVASGGLFAASAALRGAFDTNPTRGGFGAVNGTYVGSIGMAALTAGLVGAALATR